jgi:tRNA 2-selenouridine synthase SelU
MVLSADVFFNWQGARIIIDIRPADVFVKGSFAGAVSIPVENGSTWDLLTAEIKKNAGKQPIHIMDHNGSMTASFAEETDVFCLQGGYQAFKNWRHAVFSAGPPVGMIAGKTGSGKTEILQTLLKMGRQVIDLEGLARHKGSVFGSTHDKQPPLEDFLNTLLSVWLRLDASVPVWMEEKGKVLGKLGIPETLYEKMRHAVLFELLTGFDARLQHIQKEYTGTDPASFAAGIRKLEKRMGFSANHKALHYHHAGQVEKCLSLLLAYYDQAYAHKRKAHPPRQILPVQPAVFSNEKELQKLENLILENKEPRNVCRGELN